MQIIASRRPTAHDRTSRTTVRSRRVQTMMLALSVAALAVPAIAMAVVNEPPVLPHAIISFPQRDFISGSGFGPGQHITYNIIRNGVTIATSDPVVADATGLAEVNHPGGGCWLTTTPDVLPGDQVRSTVQETGVQDQTTTANVTAARPTNPSAGTIVVRGTATAIAGGQIPIAQIEQRLVSGKDLFAKNGKRTLRASGAGADGKLSYDSATSTNFTATYTGLIAADVTRAMAAESRALWLGVNPGTLAELTIYENPATGGPAPPCTAPLASNAITASDHTYNSAPTVNIANSGTALGLSGVAQADVTSVSVTVTDRLGAATTPVSVALPGGTAGQTWNVVVPAAQIAALADGTLTASMTYTTAAGTLAGAGLKLAKDTIAPPAPDATPAGGTYTSNQSVLLFDADPGTSILYTTNGSTPATAATATGITKLYGGAISVTTSQTINALAVDGAGNPSTVSSNVYALVASAVLTPTAIDYGAQDVGTSSLGRTVTMTNRGAASMTISAVALTGSNPGSFARGINTCTGATLNPGESCTVDNVRFQPQSTGALSAALTFTDNAPGGSHSVSLSGTGSGPAISAAPDPVAFGAAKAGLLSGTNVGGSSTSASVTVKNTGTANLTVGASSVTASANSGDFSITSDGCTGKSLAPGAICSIALRFAPLGPVAPAGRTATLSIPSNASAASTSVTLNGTAT